MLLPEEISFLQRSRTRLRIQILVVGVAGMLLALAPTLLYAAGNNGFDHLLGGSTAVTATVDDVTAVDDCGKDDREEYRIEISWTFEGTTHHDSYTRCGNAPEAGEKHEVWITADGHMERFSPTSDRIGLAVVGGIGCTVVWCIGGLFMLLQQRPKRRLLAEQHRPLLPGIPVHVRQGPKWVWIRHHTPQFFGTHLEIPMVKLLYSLNGSVTFRLSTPTGPWWLHPMQHTTNPRRRIGLLVRGNERCWVEFIRG